MSTFNNELSLAQNIRGGLFINNKTLDDMAKELDISKQNISVAISRKFKRGENITPQNKKMIAYLKEHCKGFSQWSKQNNLHINS